MRANLKHTRLQPTPPLSQLRQADRPLADIARINPRRPPDFAHPPDNTPTAFIPMTAVQVNGGGANPVLRPYGEVRRGYTFFQSGDVMFAKITPCMQNGKHFIAPQTPGGFGFASTEFHVIRPDSGVPPEWIHFYLRQPSVLEEAKRHFSGTAGQQRVPPEFLMNLEIPLPPLAEQKRIVKSLSANLRRAEKMKAAMQAQVEITAALPESILSRVFMRGKNAPKEWQAIPLGELCHIVPGKTPARSDRAAFTGNRPWAKIGDMGGVEEISETKEMLTDEAIRKYNCRLVQPGTLLLSFKLSIGKMAFAGVPMYTNEAIAALPFRDSAKKRIVPEYLLWALRSMRLDENAPAAAKGKTLNRKILETVPIPVPPLSEQRIITRMLKAKMKVAAKLDAVARAQLDAVEALPAAFLRRAFSPR